MGGTLQFREALDQAATGALRRMAALHGISHDDATTRAELIERLTERLADLAYLAARLEALAPDEYSALRAAVNAGGEIRGFLIQRDFPGALEELTQRGFLVRTFTSTGPRRGEVFALPAELLAVLPPPPSEARPPSAEPAPVAPRSSDPAFSLFTLASALLRPKASIEAEARGWSEEPGGWQSGARWRFLEHLAVSCGLLAPRPDGHLGAASALLSLLANSTALSMRLWATYLEDHAWPDVAHALPDPAPVDASEAGSGGSEGALNRALQAANVDAALARTPSAAHDGGSPARTPSAAHDEGSLARNRSAANDRGVLARILAAANVDAALVRAAPIELVERLPAGEWVRLEAFTEWLHRMAPEFLREQLDAHTRLQLEDVEWESLEAPLARYLLLGPLYWLGRIGASADGTLIARRAVPRAVPPEPCTWLESDDRQKNELEKDELATTRARQPELSAATQQPELGARPQEPQLRASANQPELIAQPEQPERGAATELPELVAQPEQPQLGASAEEPESIAPAEHAELVARPQQPAPIAQAEQPELSATTKQPELVAQPEQSERSAAAEPRGLVAPADKSEPVALAQPPVLVAPARADLAALLQAERYLVLEERGRHSRYRLDQPRVAAALAAGGSLVECRGLLERLVRGPLPAAVEALLQTWSQRFGAVAVRPAVIVETRSPADLDALQDDLALRPFLRRRLGPTTAEVAAAAALSLVEALRDAGHLPRVDAALRLAADARQAYSGLIDEQVLEFLLVSLLAFNAARPEQLAELEGATSLLERLQHQFPRARLTELRAAAARLAGDLRAAPPPASTRRNARRQRRPRPA